MTRMCLPVVKTVLKDRCFAGASLWEMTVPGESAERSSFTEWVQCSNHPSHCPGSLTHGFCGWETMTGCGSTAEGCITFQSQPTAPSNIHASVVQRCQIRNILPFAVCWRLWIWISGLEVWHCYVHEFLKGSKTCGADINSVVPFLGPLLTRNKESELHR